MTHHTGRLSGRIISTSARCIVYDHRREAIYLSSDNRSLITDVAEFQQKRDTGGITASASASVASGLKYEHEQILERAAAHGCCLG